MPTKPPASCHPDKPSYRAALCVNCYTTKMGRTSKPGQILCGMPTKTGKPCIRWRDLDKQCRLHPRTLDDLEEVARKHCELTDQELPAAFGNAAEQLEIQRQEWLVQFKLLGCRYGQATEAAVKIGITENTKQFASFARKHFKDEISAWMDEQAMPANEAVAMLARIARNEASQYYIVENGELRLDVERMIADGNGDLIKGMKETKYGPVYELRDPDANLAAILDVHGLRRQKMEHTGAEGGMITVRYVDDHHSGLSGDNAD